jgi:SAM-dependent methyltransferase
MLDVVREQNGRISVLDLGCGLAHLLDHMNARPERQHLCYTGLDISNKYLSAARARHPEGDFILRDVLDSDEGLADYDYVILNGLFNYRGPIDQERMLDYLKQLTVVAYRHCRRGIAFNVMSKIVDWEREDLFHLSFDAMAQFVGQHLSRFFVIRHDYRAFEYTTYVYRSPFAL